MKKMKINNIQRKKLEKMRKNYQSYFLYRNIQKKELRSQFGKQELVIKLKEKFTQKDNLKLFDFYGPYVLPIKALVGISSPALSIEIGINDESKLEALLDPVASSLNFLVNDN